MKSYYCFFLTEVWVEISSRKEIVPYLVNGWIRAGSSYIFLNSYGTTSPTILEKIIIRENYLREI